MAQEIMIRNPEKYRREGLHGAAEFIDQLERGRRQDAFPAAVNGKVTGHVAPSIMSGRIAVAVLCDVSKVSGNQPGNLTTTRGSASH